MEQRRVTSREVALRAGVSRTAVSFVLNGVQTNKVSAETRARVLQAARELGYVPDAAARTLVSGKTGALGLVVSRAEHFTVDAFIPQTLNSLIRVCTQHGYRLLIETSENGEAYDYDQLVGAKQIDGLVVLNPDPNDERLAALVERNFPIALIGAYPHPNVATVSVNSVTAMERMTSHLIHMGHERIGFIHYREMLNLDIGGRYRGYRTALQRASLPFDASLVRSGNYSADSGHAAMQSLLRQDNVPTAVVTGNDTIALGAIAAITESGRRVPEDIAVVGFDDIPLARYVSPALTTMRMPVHDMAEECGRMVLKHIEGEPPAHPRRVFEADLIVRRSCGADPG